MNEYQEGNDLFLAFYDNVIDRSSDKYIHYNGTEFTYARAYAIIYGIMNAVKAAGNGKPGCVALNCKDQLKLLLSFWACTALGTDIIIIPELEIGTKELEVDLTADIMISDFITGPACLNVDIDAEPVEVPGWQPFAGSAYLNIFMYTSGTTGKSKFIKTSYYQLSRAIACISEHKIMPYTWHQNVLITVPLFHSYGLSAMVEYTKGGSYLFLPKSKEFISPLQTLMNAAIAKQITAIEGVPYFYKQMAVIINRLQLPALQHIGFGGDAVLPELIVHFAERNPGLSLSIRYGVTEIPSVISLNYFKAADRQQQTLAGSILPIYSIKLFDEQGEVHPTEGELVVECLLYPNQPLRIHTNDIVKLADTGLLFKSRKIFIKYKGYKINPVEIEGYLNTYPGIKDTKVHLVNEVLTAEVVTVNNQAPDAKLVRNFLANYVSTYMIPDQFVAVDQVKRTASGKIIRS